jgi:hypothetical protein
MVFLNSASPKLCSITNFNENTRCALQWLKFHSNVDVRILRSQNKFHSAAELASKSDRWDIDRSSTISTRRNKILTLILII